MCFVEIPNLPEFDVTCVAMSNKYPKFIDVLSKMKIDVIPIKSCGNLSTPINCHADMICHHLGSNKIIVAKGEDYLKNKFDKLGFNTKYSEKCLDIKYPSDVILNAARIGNKIFANKKFLDDTIIRYCEKNNIQTISVNQGYTKCSTVIINCNSIITEDSSIAKAAKKYNFNVLQISPGYVFLEGYEYGFLGGACGMISKNTLAFTGNIKKHYDYVRIVNFCNNRNINVISLTDDVLTDVGGIVPLKVK